jgi:alpha-ketoglutarate-dependent taurine dioxygenase
MLRTSCIESPVTVTDLTPFGRLLQARCVGQDLRTLPVGPLRELTQERRLLVLRGFARLDRETLPAYCATWGEILVWDFGTVLELIVHDTPQNYLFTNGSVPYHWDGAFAERTPHFEFFQCLQAPLAGTGGETLFCDTTRLWQEATDEQRALWQRVRVTYATEKVAHYGGQVTAALVDRHPVTGETVLRYGEPPNADTADLNPFALDVAGVPAESVPDFMRQLRDRLYDPRYAYTHAWQEGDIIIADNHALLHARRAFRAHSPRHLQRVHIL